MYKFASSTTFISDFLLDILRWFFLLSTVQKLGWH